MQHIYDRKYLEINVIKREKKQCIMHVEVTVTNMVENMALSKHFEDQDSIYVSV